MLPGLVTNKSVAYKKEECSGKRRINDRLRAITFHLYDSSFAVRKIVKERN